MNEEIIEFSENNYNRDDLEMVFCPMCEDVHKDNSMCQYPDAEQC